MLKYSIFSGIDLSKKTFDAALCLDGNLEELPHRQFPQTQEGYQSLLDWMGKIAKRNKLTGKWKFCMEHTGIYALSLCHFLEANSQEYILENPLRIKRSTGLKRGKDDKADSKAIAIYAWRYQKQLHKHRPLPNLLLIKLQSLLSLRSRLVRYRQGLQTASGELDSCAPKSVSESVVSQTAIVTEVMTTSIKEIMQQVEQLINSDAELKRLRDLASSVIGIGPIISAYLLVYTNGFTAFDNPRQFACYIGVVPFERSSGTSVREGAKVSPVANRTMKALLSTAATVGVQWDPQLKAYFRKQSKRGKEEGWIYNSVKNKLIHRIFIVIKRGTPYVKLAH